jgi:hypothetical protein
MSRVVVAWVLLGLMAAAACGQEPSAGTEERQWRAQVPGEEAWVDLPVPADATEVVAYEWSPDGTTLTFAGDLGLPPLNWSHSLMGVPRRDVWIVQRDGTNLARITYHETGHDPAWSPDGKHLTYVQLDGLWVIELATQARRLLIPSQLQERSGVGEFGFTLYERPKWSPDGRWIAYAENSGGATNSVGVVEVATGKAARLGPAAEPPDFGWAPDSRSVVTGDGRSLPVEAAPPAPEPRKPPAPEPTRPVRREPPKPSAQQVSKARAMLDEAQGIARKLGDEELRSRALSLVAQARAKVSMEQGLALARTIGDGYQRSWTLYLLAEQLAQTDPTGSAAAAEEALRAAGSAKPDQQGMALRNVAVLLAKTDVERALAVARSIPDDVARAPALAGVASALAEMEAQVPSETNADATPQDAGSTPAEAEPTRSAQLAAEALELARGIADAQDRDVALFGVAWQLAKTQPETALQATSEMSPKKGRWRAQVALAAAEALAKTDLERALEVASGIEEKPWPSRALRRVALAAAEADSARAEEIARSIEDDEERANALAGLARAWAGAEQARTLADEALAVAHDIPEAGPRGWALAGIVGAVAAANPQAALLAARAIGVEGLRVRGLCSVATALAWSDPTRSRQAAKEALTAARQIAAEAEQADALSAVVVALAPTDPDGALQAARGIVNNFQRALAMRHMAWAILTPEQAAP